LLSEIKKSGFSHEVAVVEKLRNGNVLRFPKSTFSGVEDKIHALDVFAIINNKGYEIESRSRVK
jgi:hypothetical protein